MRVAFYERVSTERQAEHDLSLPSQRRALTKFVEERGWTTVATYVERGRSATTDDRPEFQRMMADACAGNFDVVLVYSTSRLFRSVGLFETYVARLERLGVAVLSATQNIHDGESGTLLRQFSALMDEHASRENSKNVKRVMKENAERGYWNGSPPPYGYRTEVVAHLKGKDKKVLAPDPVEAPVVQRIFHMALNGDGRSGPMGCKALASWLNERGYRTRRGCLWHIGSVHVLLTNRAYVGSYEFGRKETRTGLTRKDHEVVTVTCPSLVEQPLWDRVQAQLRSRNPKVGAPRVVSGPILLTGTARCGACGGHMTIRTGKSGQYRYYTCTNAQSRGATACSGSRVRMDELDQTVTSTLVGQMLRPEKVEAFLTELADHEGRRREQASGERVRVEQELADRRAVLARLYDAIERGIVTLDGMLQERVERARVELGIAEEAARRLRTRTSELGAITPAMVVAFSDLMRDRVQHGEVPFRKAYIQAIVDRVTVSDEEVTICGRTRQLRDAVAANANQPVPSSIGEWRTRHDSNV